MAEAVVVGVRVRPFNDREKGLNAEVCIDMDGPTTRIRDSNGKETPFTFDESFWSHDGFQDDGTGYNVPVMGHIPQYADQRYVFDTFGQRVLNNAWEGFHCCLFAYGQTGAGKSYSMVGYGKNKGIVPISCEEIFIRIAANTAPDKSYEVTVSMIEIYNETVQDLLIMPEDRPKKGLEIRESKLLGIYIDGVNKRPVSDYPSIEACIDEATSHRTVGSTLMNATSSRAHTVQTIEFKQIEKIGGKQQVKISMINLVDLAGSEKAGQTGATGDRLKEGAAINKSLSALGNVIEKLADKSSGNKKVLIPYRDSKLTRLLQNALGGSSKTIMICALSPASSNYEETLSTLRYADRAKKIKNTAVINENPQDRIIRELKEENAKLKEMMESLAAGGPVDQGKLTEVKEQQKEIEEVEKALAEMEKSFEQRVMEAKEREMEQKTRRRTTLSALMRSTVPQFINLNEDPQLTGRIKYNIDEGKVTRIGCHKEESDTESSQSESSETEEDGKDDADQDDEGAQMEAEKELKSKLDPMSIEELKDKAQEVGASSEQLANADEAEDPKAALIEVVVQCTPKKEQASAPKKSSAKEREPSDSESSDDEDELPDILLLSESIYPRHAYVTNKEGRCYLMSVGEAAEVTWINGTSVAELLRQQEAIRINAACVIQKIWRKHRAVKLQVELPLVYSSTSVLEETDVPSTTAGSEQPEKPQPQEKQPEGILLNHGDRVIFGRCYFFYCIPTEGVPEMMIMSGQVDYQTAYSELSRNNKRAMTQHGHTHVHGVRAVMFAAAKFRANAGRHLGKGQAAGGEPDHMDIDDDEGLAHMNIGTIVKEKDQMLQNLESQLAAAREQIALKDAIIYELQKQLHIALGGDGSAPGAPHLQFPGPGNGLPQKMAEALIDRGSLSASRLSFTNTGGFSAPAGVLPPRKSNALDLLPASSSPRPSNGLELLSKGRQAAEMGSAGLFAPPQRLSQLAGVGSAAPSALSQLSGAGGAAPEAQRLSQLPRTADESLPSLLGSASRAIDPEDAESGQVLDAAGREAPPRSSYKASGISHKIQKSFADAINVIDVVEATLTNLKDRKEGARKKAGKVSKAKG